mgnify:CR=1 FL=1
MTSALAPRLLAWGMASAGLGIGLIVASFVGEDTPQLRLWGLVLSCVGAVLVAAYRFLGRRSSGQ